jgi:hypothetical protein
MLHLIMVEGKKALTLNKLLLCLAIILLPTTFQFMYVSTGFMFYRPVEVHSEVVGGVIALLFPILFIVLYSNSYANDIRDHFITYVKPRANLSNYLFSKGIFNALLTFLAAFSMVFVSFLFIVFIEPSFQIIHYENGTGTSVGTFEIFLSHGTLTYGLIYSFWVGVNAALYSTLALVLTLIVRNSFLAMSLPFLWYFIMNFVAAILGHPEFSTVSTVFPFNIIQQPIWTIFIPFSIHLFILFLLISYVKIHFQERVIEHVS